MKILNSLLIITLVLSISPAQAANGWIPVDDTFLDLPGPKFLRFIRRGDHEHEINYVKWGKVVWKKAFYFEYDRLWDYAFFVPIKKGQYFSDINGDGYLEVAIGTWDGGNNMRDRTVLIFTVKETSLKYLTEEKFNLVYGTHVY